MDTGASSNILPTATAEKLTEKGLLHSVQMQQRNYRIAHGTVVSSMSAEVFTLPVLGEIHFDILPGEAMPNLLGNNHLRSNNSRIPLTPSHQVLEIAGNVIPTTRRGSHLVINVEDL